MSEMKSDLSAGKRLHRAVHTFTRTTLRIRVISDFCCNLHSTITVLRCSNKPGISKFVWQNQHTVVNERASCWHLVSELIIFVVPWKWLRCPVTDRERTSCCHLPNAFKTFVSIRANLACLVLSSTRFSITTRPTHILPLNDLIRILEAADIRESSQQHYYFGTDSFQSAYCTCNLRLTTKHTWNVLE